ncbi:MAG: hypothetical protein IT384_07295 [Deltaproteobacteria bacterium]|nr:hypothetical protein [Deltaproteobacteria bacterium]
MPDTQVTSMLRTALELLQRERTRVAEQVEALEKLLGSSGAAPRRGPGRPRKAEAAAPTVQAAAPAAGPRPRKKPRWSPAARAAARARAKAMWAKRRQPKGGKAAKRARKKGGR